MGGLHIKFSTFTVILRKSNGYSGIEQKILSNFSMRWMDPAQCVTFSVSKETTHFTTEIMTVTDLSDQSQTDLMTVDKEGGLEKQSLPSKKQAETKSGTKDLPAVGKHFLQNSIKLFKVRDVQLMKN